MLIVPPPQSQRRRGRAKRSASGPVGAPLTLVYAYFDENTFIVTIRFDRAVNIDAIQTGQITVNDGLYDSGSFSGGTAELSDPVTVVVSLEYVGEYDVEQQTLTATGLTGIVAADDGGTWAGVTDLGLPFP